MSGAVNISIKHKIENDKKIMAACSYNWKRLQFRFRRKTLPSARCSVSKPGSFMLTAWLILQNNTSRLIYFSSILEVIEQKEWCIMQIFDCFKL